MKSVLLHRRALTPPTPPPSVLVATDAAALSQPARLEHARAVRRWLNGIYFDSERDRIIRATLRQLIEDNAEALTGTRDVALLTGDNVLGKSTLLYQLAFDLHRGYIAPHTDPESCPERTIHRGRDGRHDDWNVDHLPVLFLSLAAGTTVSKFNAQVIEALGYAPSFGRSPAYLDLVERHGVRVIIVDDLHLLKASEKLGREALDHLKAVVTAVGELGVTVIFAGANLHTHPVMDDRQVTGRGYELRVQPYNADTRDGAVAWQRLLKEAGQHLLPYLPAAGPGLFQEDLPGLLLARSQGYMRDVVQLLRQSTILAIEEGAWTVTERHVNAVMLPKRAEDTADLVARRGRAAGRSSHPTVSIPGAATVDSA